MSCVGAGQSARSGYEYADEFEFGLDRMLDGLERLRDTAWCTRSGANLLTPQQQVGARHARCIPRRERID